MDNNTLMDTNNSLNVGVASFKTAKSPIVIKTHLGSCIAVCLYEPQKKIGGMLHLMMPDSRLSSDALKRNSSKYADLGIPLLIKQMQMEYDVKPEDLIAKIFGGAKILQFVNFDIGVDNEKATRKILQDYSIRIVGSKTKGEKGYRIAFNLLTGQVECQVFGQKAINV